MAMWVSMLFMASPYHQFYDKATILETFDANGVYRSIET